MNQQDYGQQRCVVFTPMQVHFVLLMTSLSYLCLYIHIELLPHAHVIQLLLEI
jgi:hypothetical protein